MGLIELIITIALVGLLVWAIIIIIPMPDKFKLAIQVVAVVFLVFYILNAFHLLGGFHDIRLGR